MKIKEIREQLGNDLFGTMECDHYTDGECYFNYFDGISEGRCTDFKNCDHKQLQRKTAECEELRTELKFKVEYIQEQREVIKDLEKKLKIAIEALKDIYDKADEIYFDKYRTSLFCEQVRSISIQALEELE